MRTIFTLFVLAMLVMLAGGAAVLYTGVYDVSASGDPHLRPTYWLLEVGMRESIKRRAAHIAAPPLLDAALQRRGLGLYQRHCAPCHGSPGEAPLPFALGMAPTPANLAFTAREWPASQLFWVAKYGIKMTGMPAWEFRLADDELWAIVAFLKVMPGLTVEAFRAAVREVDAERAVDAAPQRRVASAMPRSGPPNPRRGERAIRQYGCVTCHAIPGVVGANVPVGPALDRIGTRSFIGGVLPNTPANMVRWLRAPQSVNARTLMPDLGVTEHDAEDIAAYLSTLR